VDDKSEDSVVVDNGDATRNLVLLLADSDDTPENAFAKSIRPFFDDDLAVFQNRYDPPSIVRSNDKLIDPFMILHPSVFYYYCTVLK